MFEKNPKYNHRTAALLFLIPPIFIWTGLILQIFFGASIGRAIVAQSFASFIFLAVFPAASLVFGMHSVEHGAMWKDRGLGWNKAIILLGIFFVAAYMLWLLAGIQVPRA
jgi:hypothetical protein